MTQTSVTLPATGSGTNQPPVATDLIATLNYQQVKLVDGTIGSTTPAIVTAAGALKTDPSAVTQPVSGTFWQATQPISGTFWQATQPVSGTFWQAGVALTNRSGTITTGGTSQVLAAANAARRYLLIENLDATEDLWVNFTAVATIAQPSVKLVAGGSLVMDAATSTDAVNVIAATTGHAFAAKEG